ncbi:MAG: ATP-binding protein [Nanoarchaeota archaeon]
MEQILNRKLEKKLWKVIGRREIIGLRGARQSGKTTLLKIIEMKLSGNKAFLNFDLAEHRRTLEETPVDLVKRFKKENEKLFFFLDEIQKVKDAGEKLKIIYDQFPEVKMFISGSSSLELKTKVLPALVGRLFLYELYTFDFEEFLSAKDEGLARVYKEKKLSLKNFFEDADEIAQPSFKDEFLGYWKEYLVFGGYPEVVKSSDDEEKKLILKNIFNLYLEKDIINFFRIEETSKFEDFLKVLAFGISNVLSVSSLSSKMNISHQKAEGFLNILQHTYTISLLKPFYKNLVTEIRKAPKIYFLDFGLRNSVINNFLNFDSRTDGGELMENFVFRELTSAFEDYKVNYWRTTGKAEVDFVLSKSGKLIPIEVRLSEGKLGKSFYSFLKSYQPEKAVIVTLDKFAKQVINRTTIYWVPVFYF